MKGTGAAIKVGLTAILIGLLGWVAFKFAAKGLKAESGYPVWATFRDATGFVEKSRVQIAGLVIGELRGRQLFYEPRSNATLAKVSLAIKPDVTLWSNAAIYKRSSSLLGEFYIEIDPGTPTMLDPATGKAVENYPLKGCHERGLPEDCDRIRNVVEAVTLTDVMVQLNETMPVLRDILRDVHELTRGPITDIAREVGSSVKTNSLAIEQLIGHVDQITQDLHKLTSPEGEVYDDLRASIQNVRDITDGMKSLLGKGDGEVSQVSEKLKRDLDQIDDAMKKVNKTLDQVGGIVDRVAEGQGTIGKLVSDDTIARNISDLTEDGANFARTIFRLQTLVEIREEYNVIANAGKTYVGIRLMPRPDKYYLLEFVDDPRGSRNFSRSLQTNSVVGTNQSTQYVLDTWTRTNSFRFSFQFAKRIGWKGMGFTGRLGIKESTGGVGFDFDVWKQRIQLRVDLFDFMTSTYPRLKLMAAIEIFKHIWLIGGVDDVINQHTEALKPSPIGCSPGGQAGTTPTSWCHGGFDYFFGAMLTFNDEDLRALLTIGGSALGGIAR